MPTLLSAAGAAATTGHADGYIRVPVSALRVPGAASVDVYCLLEGHSEPKLLWNRSFELRDEHLAELRAGGFTVLWTSRGDAELVAKALKAQEKYYLGDPSFSPCERFLLAQFTATSELDSLYKMLRAQPSVEYCLNLGPQLSQALTASVKAEEFFRLRLRGQTPASRLTVVAGFCVLLARGLGITGADELGEIAVGALVHDIGARRISKDQTANPGRWSAEERAAIEGHPQQGYEELAAMKLLNRGQLMMAYQHHERVDGTGYPVAVTGEEIHPWARLLAVADRFDGLTAGRLMRRPLSLEEATERLLQDAGTWLDGEMTQCWISLLKTT
jgi:response regulator RpfG family c-di-GMP phosphodiesterase